MNKNTCYLCGRYLDNESAIYEVWEYLYENDGDCKDSDIAVFCDNCWGIILKYLRLIRGKKQ